MVAEHNRRVPKAQITEEDFQKLMMQYRVVSTTFYTADGAIASIEALKESGKAIGLVTTRGNNSRDRLLTHHGFDTLFDVIVGRGDAEQTQATSVPITLAIWQIRH